MSLLLDFLPLLIFFGAYKWAHGDPQAASQWATEHLGLLVSGGVVSADVAPVLLATLAIIVATFVQVAVMKAMRRPIQPIFWISLAMVVLLGGLTVYFHSETFIKLKPTGYYWAVALILLISQYVFGKNPIRALLGAQMQLPATVWNKLNLSWGLFFLVLGVANLVIAYSVSTDTWVNIKVFGFTAVLFAFVIIQAVFMSKYLPSEGATGAAEKQP